MGSNPVANIAAMGGTDPSAAASEMVSRSRIRIMLSALGVRFTQEQNPSWDVIIYIFILADYHSWATDSPFCLDIIARLGRADHPPKSVPWLAPVRRWGKPRCHFSAFSQDGTDSPLHCLMQVPDSGWRPHHAALVKRSRCSISPLPTRPLVGSD